MSLRGSKLRSVDVQLQQCKECKEEGYTVIGKLSYCMNCNLGRADWTGGYVFRGKFEGTVDVAVKRLHKQKTGIITTVEPETLSVVVHPNIVRYYATEQDRDFWYVNVNNEE